MNYITNISPELVISGSVVLITRQNAAEHVTKATADDSRLRAISTGRHHHAVRRTLSLWLLLSPLPFYLHPQHFSTIIPAFLPCRKSSPPI
jgi:hypothetical protein